MQTQRRSAVQPLLTVYEAMPVISYEPLSLCLIPLETSKLSELYTCLQSQTWKPNSTADISPRHVSKPHCGMFFSCCSFRGTLRHSMSFSFIASYQPWLPVQRLATPHTAVISLVVLRKGQQQTRSKLKWVELCTSLGADVLPIGKKWGSQCKADSLLIMCGHPQSLTGVLRDMLVFIFDIQKIQMIIYGFI